MKLPPPDAPAADVMSYVDLLEDEVLKDPNRIAWDASKQRWLDLYTGNHWADALPIATRDTGREPEEVAQRSTTSTVVRVVYNRVMNAVLAHLAGQVGNSPKVVFNARESGEPPIYYLNGYVENPIVQQMAMAMGGQDPRVQELQGIYGGALPGEMEYAQPYDQAGVMDSMAAGQGAAVENPAVAGVQPAGADSSMASEFQDQTAPTQNSDGLANVAGVPRAQQAPMHPDVASAAQQIGMSIPLQEPFVTQLKQQIDMGRILTIQARAQGLPPPLGIIPPEALVEITDQTTAQFAQTVYDALWEQCGGIEAVNECILNKKVLGWQATLFESDRAKIDAGESPITLTNVEGMQVYLDPMTSSFRVGQYRIMLEPVPYEECIAKYPEHTIAIRNKAEQGTLGNRLSKNGAGGRLSEIQFGRDMCVIRTVWIRNWPYPMEPDEALQRGKVQIVEVPDESAIGQPQSLSGGGTVPADVRPQAIEGDADLRTGERESGSADGPAVQSGVGPADGRMEPDGAGQPEPQIYQPVPTRQAFIATDTGAEVTPGGPGWPIIFAIREIRDIEGEICFDRRCKLPSFPIETNINIPVPHSPYGIGEPDRLDGLQMAINRVLSDLLTMHRYNAYPPELMHEVTSAALKPHLRKRRSQPNDIIVVPTHVADQLGGDLKKAIQFMDLPPLPAEAWRLLEFLVEAIDKEAGNSEVNQGIAPSGSSGAWVANLQAAATQVTQVTSMSTEAWLRKLVRLFVHFIAHDMTVQDIQKYTSKYPPPILEAFHSRAKNLYLDISVEIQSGSAAAKQGRTAAMVQARQTGIPVSAPTIMDALNLDADAELKRQGDFNQKMIETGAVEAMAQPGQEQEGQGEKKQSNAA